VQSHTALREEQNTKEKEPLWQIYGANSNGFGGDALFSGLYLNTTHMGNYSPAAAPHNRK